MKDFLFCLVLVVGGFIMCSNLVVDCAEKIKQRNNLLQLDNRILQAEVDHLRLHNALLRGQHCD